MIKLAFKRGMVGLALAAVASWAGMPVAQAAYPERAVRVVVAYPAGGSVDPPARLLAKHLADRLGQQFFVDNRPGAGGNIGTEFAIGQPADGYTLTLTGPHITISPSLMPATTRFDPNTSFAHIARFMTLSSAIAVPANSPFKTLDELIAFARQNPGKLTYGSPGNGSPSQLAMEIFLKEAGIQILHVPYKGAAPAIVDLLGGQVDVLAATTSGPLTHIKSGAMRALAVTSGERDRQLPDVPAVAETLPGFEVVSWLGYAAPAGTPPEVVQKLADSIRTITEEQDFQNGIQALGGAPAYLGPAELAAAVAKEARFYGEIIRDAKLAAN